MDFFATRVLFDPLAIPLTVWLARVRGITPNMVTFLGFLIGMLAALLFGFGYYRVGAIGYYLFYLLDCVDGKLARVTNQGSPMGVIYDFMSDRTVVGSMSVGLAISFFAHGWLRPCVLIVIYIVLFLWKDALSLLLREPVLVTPPPAAAPRQSILESRRWRIHFRPGQIFSCFAAFLVAPLTQAWPLWLSVAILAMLFSLSENVVRPLWRRVRLVHRAAEPPATRYLILRPSLAPYRVDFLNHVLRSNPTGRLILLGREAEQTFTHEAVFGRLSTPYAFAPYPRFLGRHWAFLAIPSILRRYHPQVLVTTEFSVLSVVFSLIVRLWPVRKLIVWTDDAVYNLEHDFTAGRQWRRRWVLRAASALVCCNKQVEDYYRQQHPRLPVCCAHILQDPEVVTNALVDARGQAEQQVEKYRLRGKKVVLFVGRLHPLKNLPCLLRALAAIAEPRRRDVVLIIIGAGGLDRALQHLCRKLQLAPSVIFAGEEHGRSLWAWYNVAQLLVLPSVNERFGAVVNEALLAGMPVLCSRHAGAEDLIVPGVNGDLIDPLQISDVTAKLERYLATLPALTAITVRPSLMVHSYAESVEAFLKAIECALAAAHGNRRPTAAGVAGAGPALQKAVEAVDSAQGPRPDNCAA